MNHTLAMQRGIAASKITVILLATGATLTCFATFGLARNFVFPTSGTRETGIHPRTEIPQLEIKPTTWAVPTATPDGMDYQPAEASFQRANHSIPGCNTEADGIIRCWNGATPVPWALIPGDTWEDADGNRHTYGEPVGVVKSNRGFRTDSGLRKDK